MDFTLSKSNNMAITARASSPLAAPQVSPVPDGGANLRHKPGKIWSERFSLSEETQKVLNGAALFKVNDGELCIDVDTVEKLSEYNVETKDVLTRFCDSLRGEQIKEFQGVCSPGHKSPTVGVTKANGVGRGCPAVKAAPPVDDDRAPFGIHNKRKTEEEPAREERSSKKPNLGESDASGEYRNLARKVECLQVPIGASSGDRITFMDTANKKMTKAYIRIPINAHEGMLLAHLKPPSHFKVLLADGTGFKAGDNLVDQHAARLHTHRSRCTNCMCNVLGCNGDDAYKLFEPASSVDTKARYERHWILSNRSAVRTHGENMRIKASYL